MKRLVVSTLRRTVATTTDIDRADRSRFVWGQVGDDAERGIWRLRVVGVINGPLRSLGIAVAILAD